MTPKYRIIPIGSGVPSGGYATSISVEMDENYVLSVQLLNQNGDPLGDEQTVDLPLESVVVGGSYDSEHQQLILTLDNGNTIEIPISGLISGLQAEITSQNPLSADLVADGTTNKVFTATEKTKLSTLKPILDLSTLTAPSSASSTTVGTIGEFYKNYHSKYKGNYTFYWGEHPIVGIKESGTALAPYVYFTYNVYSDSSTQVTNVTKKNVLSGFQLDWQTVTNTINIPTKTSDLNNDSGFVAVSGTDDGTNWTSITIGSDTKAIPSGGGSNAWYGSQWEFDALGTYDEDTDYFISDKIDYNTELKNTPNLSLYATKTEVNNKNAEQDNAIASKMSAQFMTQQEFEQITPKEGDTIFIEGNTIEMVVTFTDQTTATYNVVVD